MKKGDTYIQEDTKQDVFNNTLKIEVPIQGNMKHKHKYIYVKTGYREPFFASTNQIEPLYDTVLCESCGDIKRTKVNYD